MERVARIFGELWERIVRRVDEHDIPSPPSLLIDPDASDGPFDRHYAYYDKRDHVIGYAPTLELRPDSVIRGILAHELGHVFVNVTSIKEARGYDARERQADAVAEAITGLHIYYDGDDVQRAGAGSRSKTSVRPRPRGLR